jgi:molybdopterin-guanine dinucleotide biosynthesis protein A
MTTDDTADGAARAGTAEDTAHAAVILAGGRSSRMGRPKAWLALGAAPLLAHVVARVRPLVTEIVVVAAAGQELPPLGARLVPARVVRDRVPGLGPLPALVLGLESVAAPWVLALGCDAPFVRPALLALLARECADAGADAAIPLWEGRPQPLVAVYRRRLAGRLAALAAAGERRLQAIAALPDVRLVPPERLRAADPEGASFRTLNTPAEYAAALAAWEREAPGE